MARLKLSGITKRYGDFKATDDVSLDIADGEFLVLLGPSGCGKTTTLRIVAGFIEPTSGSVHLGERDITALPPWKRNAGLVFQSYALFPHMSVAENVAFGLQMRKMSKAEMGPKIREALRLVRLVFPGQMSASMKVNITPSGRIWPIEPTKCQQRGFCVNLNGEHPNFRMAPGPLAIPRESPPPRRTTRGGRARLTCDNAGVR